MNAANARQTFSALYIRYGRWSPRLAAFVLLLAIAWLAGQMVWSLLPRPANSAWAPPQSTAALPDRPNAAQLVKSIVAAHLFGKFEGVAPTGGVNVAALANAPETHLNLNLLGILADRSAPQSSRAVIASSSGDEKPYSLGEAISQGVTLKAIFPNRVVLSRKGRLETLRLSSEGIPVPSTDVNTPIAYSPLESVSGSLPQKLGAIREHLLVNPAQAGQYLRVQPWRQDGAQVGYRIYPGKDDQLFKGTGLKAGDLVTAINGQPLNDPAKTINLIGQLSTATHVQLTVKRGSQTSTINLTLAP